MSPPAPLLRADLDASVAALHAIDAATEYGLDHDMMLAPGNAQGEALNIGAVNALVAQGWGRDDTSSLLRVLELA